MRRLVRAYERLQRDYERQQNLIDRLWGAVIAEGIVIVVIATRLYEIFN